MRLSLFFNQDAIESSPHPEATATPLPLPLPTYTQKKREPVIRVILIVSPSPNCPVRALTQHPAWNAFWEEKGMQVDLLQEKPKETKGNPGLVFRKAKEQYVVAMTASEITTYTNNWDAFVEALNDTLTKENLTF